MKVKIFIAGPKEGATEKVENEINHFLRYVDHLHDIKLACNAYGRTYMVIYKEG